MKSCKYDFRKGDVLCTDTDMADMVTAEAVAADMAADMAAASH
jgi:hypothetical protein